MRDSRLEKLVALPLDTLDKRALKQRLEEIAND